MNFLKKSRSGWGILLAGLLVMPVIAADPPSVGQWIERLGSEQFSERQEATKALETLGVPALDALRQAAQSPDPEIRRRANLLVKQIEKRLAAASVLDAKKVRLNCQDAPLPEVLAELSKKAGFTLQLDPKANPSDRKVTLDTGEVFFWEAFDKLCAKANLVEAPAAPEQPYYSGYRSTSVVIIGGNRTTATDILKSDPPEKEEVITLADGKPAALPAQVTGAMRLVALPPGTTAPGHSAQTGETLVTLEVSLEPRLKWLQPLNVRITRAVDDQDQELLVRFSYLGKPVNTVSNNTPHVHQRPAGLLR